MTNNPRVVLIAGGSGGIGRACAARFLAAGDSVTIVGRSIASLEDAQDYLTKLTSTQGKLLAIQGDLSHADQAEKIAAEANSKSGRIDILVNAAGAAPRSPKQETNPETWELGMRLKFFPIIFLTHFVLPFMLARKNGAIVNIIGMGGRTPRAGHLVGSAANAALINATKGLAAQYAPFGVRINGINPGITQTPRTLRRFREIAALKMNRSLEELLADRCASIPNRRIADPMDIANVAHFLCSTDASHMIGCVVDIEGGESLLA